MIFTHPAGSDPQRLYAWAQRLIDELNRFGGGSSGASGPAGPQGPPGPAGATGAAGAAGTPDFGADNTWTGQQTFGSSPVIFKSIDASGDFGVVSQGAVLWTSNGTATDYGYGPGRIVGVDLDGNMLAVGSLFSPSYVLLTPDSQQVVFSMGSTGLTATRNFTIFTGDADRSLTILGDIPGPFTNDADASANGVGVGECYWKGAVLAARLT
jgi:hypothetical protein